MKSLSPRRQHEITEIVHEWEDECAHSIVVGLPTSSPNESPKDKDPTMEEASDDEPVPTSVADFTMAQRTSTPSWWRWSRRSS